MIIDVYHAKNPDFGFGADTPKFPSEFERVAYVFLKGITNVDDALKAAYRLTNHIDKNWKENKGVIGFTGPQRSSSMGDVFQINHGKLYKVMSIGFGEMC